MIIFNFLVYFDNTTNQHELCSILSHVSKITQGFVNCILNSLNGCKNQITQCSDLLPTMSLSKSSIRTPSSWCVSSFMSTNLRNSLLFSWFTISIILPSCDLDKIVDASLCETNWKIVLLHFLLFIWSLPYLSLFSWT